MEKQVEIALAAAKEGEAIVVPVSLSKAQQLELEYNGEKLPLTSNHIAWYHRGCQGRI